jgi:hypothetical protein
MMRRDGQATVAGPWAFVLIDLSGVRAERRGSNKKQFWVAL